MDPTQNHIYLPFHDPQHQQTSDLHDLASPITISENLISRPEGSVHAAHTTDPSNIHISSGFSRNPTKEEIVRDWLPRYTGKSLDSFGDCILLCNFINYVDIFARLHGVEVIGRDKPFATATHDNITIMCIGMGSSSAATAMDLLTALLPKLRAVLFLGKCGGLKSKTTIGSFILPIGAIRKDGASDAYAPPELPALPAFSLQRSISTTLRDYDLDYFTGSVYTTQVRVWEHDEVFKKKLLEYRAIAIDMETATLFVTGFVNKIPVGSLLLVSDQPLVSDGIKSSKSDGTVTQLFVEQQIRIGVDSLKKIQENGETVRHLKF